jgi:hypothetical protein
VLPLLLLLPLSCAAAAAAAAAALLLLLLLQLPGLLADPNAEFVPSSFFSEQLTAFELWLAHGSADKKPPEQLPIVLQVRAIAAAAGARVQTAVKAT